MGWNINDLDKSKTEQSIANEEARLDMCKEELTRLANALERYKEETDNKLSKYYKEIANIEKSIESGEQFIAQCTEHLNDLKNAESN